MGCNGFQPFVSGHMLNPSSSIYNDNEVVAGFCSVQTHSVGCLPEPLCEHLEIFLSVCWQRCCLTLSFAPGSPAEPAEAGAGAWHRLGRWHPCMWSVSEVAPQQRQRVVDVQPWGNHCSLRRLHTAASPDPASEPAGNLGVSLVVRKTKQEIPGRYTLTITSNFFPL